MLVIYKSQTEAKYNCNQSPLICFNVVLENWIESKSYKFLHFQNTCFFKKNSIAQLTISLEYLRERLLILEQGEHQIE